MGLSAVPLSQDPWWRTISEPTFLMCPPDLYDVNYVINPWMEGNVNRSSRREAMKQWEQLHCALTEVAQVEMVEPQAGSPDMVFTANAGLVHRGVVALSSFLHPERQGEEPHFRRWFDDCGFGVCEIPRATPFEGEGDALFAVDGSCLWAGHGIRTKHDSHRHLSDHLGVDVISLRLVDPRFYHLDTCFCPLFGGYVMYLPAAFDAASQSRIETHYVEEKRIAIGEDDALRFACNAINVGRTIVLNEISNELRDLLEALGFRVVQVQLSEFLKAGGAAKCLALRLSEIDVTHTASRIAPDCAHMHGSGAVRYNSMYEENRIHLAPRLPGLGSFLGG
jgi:N-dimethylarginine dimethylaminohydrolase